MHCIIALPNFKKFCMGITNRLFKVYFSINARIDEKGGK